MAPPSAILARFEVAAIVALGAAGFGAAILHVTGGNLEALQVRFADKAAPKILLWLILIGAQGAFWAVSLAVLARWARALLAAGSLPWTDIALRCLLPTALMAVAAALVRGSPGAGGWPPRMLGQTPIPGLPDVALLGVLLALAAVVGMFLVGALVRAELADGGGDPVRLQRYLELHAALDRFLLVAALVLGLGVLATAALRDAYNATPTGIREPFAREYVVAYGAVYSTFLAIAYVAARAGLASQGARIRDALMGAPPDDPARLKEWHDRREALGTILRLRVTGLPALGEAFSVLAPLLAGAITALLGGA